LAFSRIRRSDLTAVQGLGINCAAAAIGDVLALSVRWIWAKNENRPLVDSCPDWYLAIALVILAVVLWWVGAASPSERKTTLAKIEDHFLENPEAVVVDRKHGRKNR
jgi:hypothetical protein